MTVSVSLENKQTKITSNTTNKKIKIKRFRKVGGVHSELYFS